MYNVTNKQIITTFYVDHASESRSSQFSEMEDVSRNFPIRIKKEKEEKKTSQRRKNPESWKVNIAKNARLQGLEYIGMGGNNKIQI